MARLSPSGRSICECGAKVKEKIKRFARAAGVMPGTTAMANVALICTFSVFHSLFNASLHFFRLAQATNILKARYDFMERR